MPPPDDRVALTSLRKSWAIGLFAGSLLLHLWSATHHWTLGNLPGHEFRQTQTALSIFFIQRDQDFALAYPTPLFGPPWSIPMEFPLYQWTVAKLMDVSGWTLPVAARTVSLACFYLTLPGLWMIMRGWSLSHSTRWLALTLILIAPVYRFYPRAVLIESMALMFSVWFLAGFLQMREKKSLVWWALTLFTGIAATLVKVTTFFPWCLLAAGAGLRWSWTAWRQEGVRGWGQTVAFGVTLAGIIGLVNHGWIRTADEIKSQSLGGADLMSAALSNINFGSWSDRFGVNSLVLLNEQLTVAFLPSAWLLPLLIGGGMAVARRTLLPLGLGLIAVVTVATFPVLYHRHDYYFFAIAALPAMALAIIATTFARSAWACAITALVLLGIAGVQHKNYRQHYWPLQDLVSYGGTGLTNFIRDMLPPEDALIIVGRDWIPVIPYYAQRRALMIRDNVAADPEWLDRYLAGLDGIGVGALIVFDPEQKYASVVDQITTQLNLDPRATLQHEQSAVHLGVELRDRTIHRLRENFHYSGITALAKAAPPPPPPVVEPIVADQSIQPVLPSQVETIFFGVTPRPARYRCQFGIAVIQQEGVNVLGVHPEADLWVPVAPEASRLTYSLGLSRESYADLSADADGVVFFVDGIDLQDRIQRLAEHTIDPFRNKNHRQRLHFSLNLPPHLRELQFGTRGRGSLSFDWAYWGEIRVE